MTEDRELLGRMQVQVDGGEDPTVNIMALVEVTKNICITAGKSPVEGVVMMLTGAAWLLDCHTTQKAELEGAVVDYEKLIEVYMRMCAHGWNMNGLIFKGIDPKEMGCVVADEPFESDDDWPTDAKGWN